MHPSGWGGLRFVATKFNNFVVILCMNIIFKYVNIKYDKGHHANLTMEIKKFMDPNTLFVLQQIYLDIFIP
jgi:hypothetical protein